VNRRRAILILAARPREARDKVILPPVLCAAHFASEEAANRWLNENDPDGDAFEYPVQEYGSFHIQPPAA
jgi:hypothetical protein